MGAIDPGSVSTQTFDWGQIKWYVTPEATGGSNLTFGEVILMPGKGHGRHNHLDAEEVLYVLSGESEQVLDDGEPFQIGAGDTVHVPKTLFHSTMNTGWAPMRLLALYNPGGAEKTLEELPDFEEVPPDRKPDWSRA